MTPTTVNPKGQVTIPEPIRARYGLHPGVKVAWIERDGEVFPIPLHGLRSLRGRLASDQRRRPLRAALTAERANERAREDG